MYIHKASQKLNFPQLPSVVYLSDKILLNATASSGLPVQYILSGNGEIRQDYLYPEKTGDLAITANQPGNEFYEPSDTILQKIRVEYENDFEKNLRVFPSPFTSTITMEYPDAEQTLLIIYTTRGKQLRRYSLSGNMKTIDLGFLPKGTYLLQFSSSKGTGHRIIIKQ